jgi:hypothetical protein
MHRRSSGLAIVVLAAVLALSVTSCRSAPQPPPVTVVFLDLTRSTTAAKASMLADFQVVLGQVAAEGGRLIADVLDDNPLAHSRVVVDQAFAITEAQGNRLVERQRRAARRAAAGDAVKALLDSPRPARSSDVFGALVSGAQRLQSLPQSRHRRLVFLSDMMSTTSPYNLRARRWDQAAIDRLVRDLRAAHLLPDLSGVEVWVGGASLSRGGNDLPAARIVELKMLWLAVFAATGATVTLYVPQLAGIHDLPERG